MRRTFLVLSSTALVVIGLLAPPAAQAASNAYVVVGHPITSAPGLALIGDSCKTSGANPPSVNPLERDGGTLGTSALGWTVLQAEFEAGPVATLAGNPDNLNSFQLDVLAPTGTSGHAYALINWDADTWYLGWARVDVQAGAWRHLDLSNQAYDWTLYDAGTASPFAEPLTVQELVTGPGFQAVSLGVLLGCGGEQFFVDRMVVANAENSSSYDFEKTPVPLTPLPPPPPPPPTPVSHLDWSTDGQSVHSESQVRIRYGQSLWMLGDGHLHSVSDDVWYSGLGTLTATPTRGNVQNSSRSFTPTEYAAVKVSPQQTTTYTFTADPYGGAPATTSQPMTVLVQSKVKAKVLDRHLVQGQRLSIRGKVTPGTQRVTVAIQRRLRGAWRNVASSHSGRGGRFVIGTKVRDAGTWKIRLKVGTSETNVGTVTRSAVVKVDRYVPPKPHQSPPPPDKDRTPETTSPVATAAATQVTSAAPIPQPVRPPPTGRVRREAVATEPVRVAGPVVEKP